MVAPNSPSALAKHSTMPAMMPGRASGSVTVANTSKRFAPSVQDASSSLVSTASIESRIARTSSGKPITPQASAAPVQRNENTMPNVSARNAPITPRRPNADQQQVAGHDRRQHQRQMHDAVEQRLAPEVLARQHPRDRDAERQRHDGRDDRDAQREQDRGPFVGGQGEHVLRFHDVGRTRKVKPYCSNTALAMPERRNAR